MQTTRTTAVAAAVAAAALLGGCAGQSGGTASPAPSASSSASTAPSPVAPDTQAAQQTPQNTASGPAACKSADLGLGLTPEEGGGGMNKSRYLLAFTNKGAAPCTLFGFPGVSFVTGDSGTQVGAPATKEDGTPASVTLAPGASASSHLTITNAGVYDPAQCAPADVRGLRIYPPGETAAMFLPKEQQACSAADRSLLSVGPVQS
ncbi:DUF4232 domain-containing protein [Lentzea sp. NPDC060358]|uniref:DUF4232 domain-containing protein n=1 Tax=Lentzea sp. NPDC060358 TaxID=3347103 RepID=UPI003665243E